MNDWNTLCKQYSDLFGSPALRTAEAQQSLTYRVQQEGESYTSYIEDVLALAKRVDAQMTELEKIRHITKDIREGAFQVFVLKILKWLRMFCRYVRRSKMRDVPGSG